MFKLLPYLKMTKNLKPSPPLLLLHNWHILNAVLVLFNSTVIFPILLTGQAIISSSDSLVLQPHAISFLLKSPKGVVVF